jgi:hypothetical protein
VKPAEDFHLNGATGERRPECRNCRAAARGGGRNLGIEADAKAGVKLCPRCEVTKPLSEFYILGNGKRQSYCKRCILDLGNEWDNANREKVRESVRRSWAKNTHGLTDEQYNALLESQGGGCAICGTTEPGGTSKKFHIDHDHSCCEGSRLCGECIRGLLCNSCNLGIGLFGDDPARLRSAANYQEQYVARREVMQSHDNCETDGKSYAFF